jgi:hypothetical protein
MSSDRSADEVQHNLDVAVENAETDRAGRAGEVERRRIGTADLVAGEAKEAARVLTEAFNAVCEQVADLKTSNDTVTRSNEKLAKSTKTGKRWQRVLAAVCLVLAIVVALSIHTSIQSCNDTNQSRAGASMLWHVGVGALIGPNPGPAARAGEKVFFQKVDANYMPRDCSITAWFGS